MKLMLSLSLMTPSDPLRHVGCGYGELKVPKVFGKALLKHLSSAGLTGLVDSSELHCTLMYDEGNPNLNHKSAVLQYVAAIVGAQLFGPNDDTLVLELHCPDLVRRHHYLIRMGYRHSYPDYRPHITVKLGATKQDLELLRKVVKDGVPNIELSGESWSPVS